MARAKGGLKTGVGTRQSRGRASRSRRIKDNIFIWSRERCTGCIKCAQICPVDAISIRRRATVSKRVDTAPCTQACPAHIDIPRYIRSIAEGRPAEALAVNREKIPFPAVCGLVCAHPCEAECTRGQLDETILIRILKRYAVEHDDGQWKQKVKNASPTGKKVAIIGSGPAGLTAAYYLARLGHSVTVFEALPEAGGMMLVGIPDYRLPRDILKAEIKEIEEAGVEIRTNTRIDSLESLSKEGYNAILLAVGAHLGVRLPIPGANLDGVLTGASFLRDVNLGKKVKIGNRVVVLGGGSVASDCARTALRLGAKKVHVVFLEPRDDMQALPEEIGRGLGEGVVLHPLRTFTRVVSDNGRVKGVECLRIRSFGFDSEGRVKPVIIAGTEHILAADTVIFAVGQVPELGLIEGVGDVKAKGGAVKVDSATLAIGKEGTFAAGDMVGGPASIIEAIAHGRQVATSIDKYLGGNGNIEEKLASPEGAVTPLQEAQGWGPPRIPELSPEQRLKGFAEVEIGLDEKGAVRETRRCLRCDLTYIVDEFEVDISVCNFCGRCFKACIWDALSIGPGYELAAGEREELLEENKGRGRWQNWGHTLLVLAILVIILAIVISKLASL